jgi:uncharacterized protein YdhG (YjbR/CyaY superfamily)
VATSSEVQKYLDQLPADRREALSRVRDAVRARLPKGYEEGIQMGMIGYYVPHSIHPAGYHANPKQPLPLLCLASQKNHMAIYMMAVNVEPALSEWFRNAWVGAGHKLDMGKGCVRFKRLDQVPLEVVTEVVARMPVERLIEAYATSLAESKAASAARKGVQVKAAAPAKKKAPVKAAKKKAPAPTAQKRAPTKKTTAKKR